MDKNFWEKMLVDIFDEVFSYQPSVGSSEVEMKNKSKYFGRKLIEHFDLEIKDLSRDEKGEILIKIFATFCLRITQASQKSNANIDQILKVIGKK